MNGHIAKPASISSVEELLRAICAPNVLPDENADSFDYLRRALFEELAPKTPYEQLLAEQMVALEWDAVRYRRLRDNLLRDEFRAVAEGVFARGRVGRFSIHITEPIYNINARNQLSDFIMDPNYKTKARDLVSQDGKRRQSVLAILAKKQITPSEIMAKAYQSIANDLEIFERRIAETETRRRKMRDDYDRLRASRAKPVEDAEIIKP